MPRLPVVLLAAALLLPAAAATAQEGRPPAKDAPPTVASIVEDLKSDNADTRRAAAEKAAADPSPELTAPLVRALSDGDLQVRIEVITALARRTEDRARRTAAEALVARLSRPAVKDDPLESARLVEALHDLAQPLSIKPLLEGIREESTLDDVKARLRAVANVPSAEAVEALIRFGASRGRSGRGVWAGALRLALVYALRVDVGGADPDHWRAWWREHEKGFDFAAAAADRAREREAAAEKERLRKEAEEKREKAKEERERRQREKEEKEREKKEGGGETPPPAEPPKPPSLL